MTVIHARNIIAGWAATVLVAGGVAGAGPAHAHPDPAPIPVKQWCPGQYVPVFIKDMQWDWNVCHDWHLVDNTEKDEYGVTHYHAEEGPEPPPPPGLYFCPIPPWCP